MLQTEVTYLQPNIDKHTVDTVDIHDWKLAQGSNNAPTRTLTKKRFWILSLSMLEYHDHTNCDGSDSTNHQKWMPECPSIQISCCLRICRWRRFMLVSCCVPVDSSIRNVNGWIPQKLFSSVTRTHSFVLFRIHLKTPDWEHKSICRLTFVPCMRAKLTVAIRSLSVARGTRSPLSSAYYEAIIPLVSVSI